MDPISITVGVIGTAAVALHAVHRLIEFVEIIKGAPKAVSDILTDLKALAKLLEGLETTLSCTVTGTTEVQTRMLRLLDEPLQNCKQLVSDVRDKLSTFVEPLSSDKKRVKWKKSFGWYNRENEFTGLQKLLSSYKSSLEIALSAANLWVSNLFSLTLSH